MSNGSTRFGGRVMSGLLSVATIIIIVTLAIAPLLTPMWIALEQDRAQAAAWTGFTPEQLRTATNAILADLIIGPPDFDVTVDGTPVLNEREQGHMRDVRTIFLGLWAVAAIAVVVVIIGRLRARDDRAKTAFWSAVDRGAKVLGIAVVALGVVALLAFDTLFSIFHQLLFPPGSYTFDPGTERLVQLFPFQFWQETAMVAGVIILILCGVVMVVARRQRRTAPASVPVVA